LLAEPQAAVSREELESFVARHPFWSGEWARFAGAGALADQVRFEREWAALRAYAGERGIRLVGDVPIYVAEGGADVESWLELFRALERSLGELPVIAEDLGLITPAVYRLRDRLGLPGMAVLLWAFERSASNPHAPRNHRENLVVYTSTHDTDTAAGWFGS